MLAIISNKIFHKKILSFVAETIVTTVLVLIGKSLYSVLF